MSDLIKIGLIILVVVALVIFGPLGAIWSLNTLFATGIVYTFKTWLAALVLGSCVGGSCRAGSKA